jgi:hypothetical protein
LDPDEGLLTLKNGEIISKVVDIYGCPKKYLTEEKADETHTTE